MVKVILLAVVISVSMTAVVVLSWTGAAKQSGEIVIPAGNTYLGPNAPSQKKETLSIFTAPDTTPWRQVRGSKYAYAIRVPETLPIITPSGDNPYDLLQISWGGYDPASTVLVSVDNALDPKQEKIDYVRNWWQKYSGLKAVASIDFFTNKNGLKGYKAKYVNSQGQIPNLDVFFEIPGRPDLMIHLANGILDPGIFDKIVDSVSWETQ